ncbi:TPA: hypothetical protein RPW09_001648 [Campylobacter fetus subsp. venerealis]|nr:hypothetical protein [Campylobacter fetus subsp. venerealis]HDX6244559.1 hypothetical protein [Campylobacter fetus subsp. venerealis]HDX6246564.1 hypothetical protein [Campylobacter fetus subsp. venerealis]HDX6250531.1 hypothetical protein [Campylobacter fetus subsp. venerealis]HDX6252406.1 hypothetical protein [Campylobacter fetus subsp. venerealis]
MSRKMINFDLDTKILEQEYPKKDYRQAYDDIKKFMLSNGFEHRQGSGYLSLKSMSTYDVAIFISDISEKFDWLANSAKKFDITNVGKTYDLLDNLKEVQLMKNTEQLNNMSLTITSIENLRPELQKIFKTGTEISKQDELSTLINTLDHVDKLVNIKNKNDLKFANDKETIGLKIKTKENKSFDLNIPLGSNNFSKGLEHLVAVGSNDISREKITEKEQDNYKEIVKKFGKTNVNSNLQEGQIFDKFLNGGLQSLQAFASIGGDEMKEFSNSFIKSFQVLNLNQNSKTTSPNIQTNMEKDISNLDKKLADAVKALSPKQDKEKELTTYKNLERGR